MELILEWSVAELLRLEKMAVFKMMSGFRH
jgi:hypothetical protein